MAIQNYKYRIYPFKKQVDKLNKNLFNCCIIYNELLEKKINAYKQQGKNISLFDLNKFTKKFNYQIHSQVKQNISKRINNAFNFFFLRLSKKGKKGFPRFKSFRRYNSITYPQNGFKFISNKRLYVSKIGKIPIILHRIPKGKIKTMTIKKSSRGWWIIFSCEDISLKRFNTIKERVGIDLGITVFATLSNGEEIENPKFLKKRTKQLKKYQRRLSKKLIKSKNRLKARIKFSNLHEKITNQRNDFLHKITTMLAKRFHTILIEDLHITNMVKNKYLANSILDASWNKFIKMLYYKVENTGGRVQKVNSRNTTKKCSSCGFIKNINLKQRIYTCVNCGLELNRDLNSAININNTVGITGIKACEDLVKPLKEVMANEAGTIYGDS